MSIKKFFQPSTKNSKILLTVSSDWSINNNVMLTETTSTTDWFSSSFSCGNSQNKKVHKSKIIIIHDFTIHKKGSKYYTEARCFTQVCARLYTKSRSSWLGVSFIGHNLLFVVSDVQKQDKRNSWYATLFLYIFSQYYLDRNCRMSF